MSANNFQLTLDTLAPNGGEHAISPSSLTAINKALPITINKIISDIPVYIQEELEREENSSFKIPLGSFLGSKLFSGMGPKVNVKMQIVGDLDTDLRSEFTSAGINQTLHRIYLEIKCKVIILTPFETMEEEIKNQVLIAEGVIVGDIPNAYYNLDGITKDNAIDIIE